MKSTIISFTALALICLLPISAKAQCGSPANSSIPNWIVVCPLGDVTTTVVIRDANNVPCPGQTITMSLNGNCLCNAPTNVTATTNNAGVATFAPVSGGCCNGPNLVTYIDASGVVLGVSNWVISPDMDASCLVSLGDVALFSGAFYGAYSRCADFSGDGVISLTDVAFLAQHYGH
ncbi:MAG: hypothetical protein GY780_15255 [bacterium]|nr:hypothetical protein [bacterium]